jgi:hypothetical protein
MHSRWRRVCSELLTFAKNQIEPEFAPLGLRNLKTAPFVCSKNKDKDEVGTAFAEGCRTIESIDC